MIARLVSRCLKSVPNIGDVHPWKARIARYALRLIVL